jgi:hypothetical protein
MNGESGRGDDVVVESRLASRSVTDITLYSDWIGKSWRDLDLSYGASQILLASLLLPEAAGPHHGSSTIALLA